MKPLKAVVPNRSASTIWLIVLLFVAPFFYWVPESLYGQLLMSPCWQPLDPYDVSQRQPRYACTGVLLIGPLANAGGLPA